MNYYIDFDNTLYETSSLTKLMLEAIVNTISKRVNVNLEELTLEVKNNFNSTNDNIFIYGTKISKKYNVDENEVLESIENIIQNGEKFVFEDAKRFLEKLKQKGHKIILLTSMPKVNQEYQMKKIIGSGLAKYFDNIIMTTEYKFKLDINYKNGIFIDDDPIYINGLYENNPIKVIRIRKPNNKRSKIDLENKNIEEYENFDDINIA